MQLKPGVVRDIGISQRCDDHSLSKRSSCSGRAAALPRTTLAAATADLGRFSSFGDHCLASASFLGLGIAWHSLVPVRCCKHVQLCLLSLSGMWRAPNALLLCGCIRSKVHDLWATVVRINRAYNNGLHQTGREGVAFAFRRRPVVEARPAGEARCWTDA